MRLQDIKMHINNAYNSFDDKYSTQNGNYYLENVQALRTAIKELYEAEIIVRNDLELNIFTVIDSCMTDRLTLDSSQISVFKEELAKIKYTIKMFHDWVNRYLPDNDDDTTVNIKLPPLNQIEDLGNVTNIINKALSQSVSEIGGEAKIKRLEYGSSWLVITVGTYMAEKLVMTLADAAFKIAQKYYGIKMMQQQYERISMGTDMLKTIKEANETIISKDIRKFAEDIEKEYYPENDRDNERIERLRVSINEMSKLIESGGEIHPSLICSSDNNENQPDYKLLLNVIKSAGELPTNEELTQEGKDSSSSE